jgi:hypothetical protein
MLRRERKYGLPDFPLTPCERAVPVRFRGDATSEVTQVAICYTRR